MEADLTRERGLWGPPSSSQLDKWALDMVEGKTLCCYWSRNLQSIQSLKRYLEGLEIFLHPRKTDWLKQISLAARPIRSATHIWVVTRHQYGIPALVSQTLFREETRGVVAKCRLFCWRFQARKTELGSVFRGWTHAISSTTLGLVQPTSSYKVKGASPARAHIIIYFRVSLIYTSCRKKTHIASTIS